MSLRRCRRSSCRRSPRIARNGRSQRWSSWRCSNVPKGRDALSDAESLRQLARQIAATSNTAELLSLLCEAATEHCHAGGAAVVKGSEDGGDIVAACGILEPAKGRRFELRGSLFH